MELTYTKNDLLIFNDRYENLFSLPYETSELPNTLMEMEETCYKDMRKKLASKNYSLIICLPHLPVHKVLKKAELLKENHTFKLLRISSENYNSAIEDLLTDSEYVFTFFWVQHYQKVIYGLPSTSLERVNVSNLEKNELYSFWIENEECIITCWN